jgi:hypothetical protein
MAVEDAIPLFTARDVTLIASSLPEAADPRRRELLPQVLCDWSDNDLREHVGTGKRVAPERRKRVAAIGTCARDLLRALDEADQIDRAGIAGEMVRSAGQDSLIAGWTEISELMQRLEEEVSFLNRLAEAADQTWKYGRGGPRNITAYLVMQDAAAIFEWVTIREPTREVDRDSHAEIGPFWKFLAAIWPVVFGSDDDGLSAAMKNWACLSKKHGEKSPLIVNIAMRHPTWGIFEP